MKQNETFRASARSQQRSGFLAMGIGLFTIVGAAACGVESGPDRGVGDVLELDEKEAPVFAELETTFISHDGFGNAYNVYVQYDESIAADVAALPTTFRVISLSDIEADDELASFFEEHGEEIALSREQLVSREPGALVVTVEPIGDSPPVVGREFGKTSRGEDDLEENGSLGDDVEGALVAKYSNVTASGNLCTASVHTVFVSGCFYATHKGTALCNGGTSWARLRAVDGRQRLNWQAMVSASSWMCPRSAQGNWVYEGSGTQKLFAYRSNGDGCADVELSMTCW